MATRIESFQVVVPAGTLQVSPLDTALDFVPAVVDEITILVPPGPSGLVGFAFIHSFQQIIPFQDGEFIVADNEVLRWPLSRFPEGRGWIVRAFNEDVYNHTLFIRMLLSEGGTDAAVTQLTVDTGASVTQELTSEAAQ